MNITFRCLRYVIIIVFLTLGHFSFSAVITSNSGGSWNSGSIWQGGVVPGPGDDVIIHPGHNISLSADSYCASLTMEGANTSTTLTINVFKLVVSGAVTVNPSSGSNNTQLIRIGTGELSCASLITINPGSNKFSRIDIASGILSVSGDITMGASSARNYINITGAGTVNLGGSMTGGDFVPGSLSTVNFNGLSPQVIPLNGIYTFCNILNNNQNLTLQGNITTANVTGNITLASGVLLPGNYTITGNSGKIFAMAANATLTLNGTAAFPTGFTFNLNPLSRVQYTSTATQNIVAVPSPGYGILETGGNMTKTVTGDLYIQSDILINGSASLVAGNNTLNIRGNFINNADFSSSGTCIFSGNALQSIGGTASTVFANLTLSNPAGTALNSNVLIQGILSPVTGNLTTNNNLTLISNNSRTALISGSGAGTVTGNVTLQRYLSSEFGYHYLSSPFSTGTVGDFSSFINLNASFPSFYQYDENKQSSGWSAYCGTSNPMLPLSGYCGNFGTSPAPVTISVSGQVNNGTYSRTFYNHKRTYTNGFNLAGNPYPSPVDWDAASGWTKTNIDNAVYYFNPGSTDQYSGTYSSYINGISSDGLANGIIPAFQGFFIHVSGNENPVSATLSSTNAVRTSQINPQYHKDISLTPLIRISGYSDDENKKDYLVITMDPEASDEFDPARDALKLMNTDQTYPNLFSFKQNEKLSVHSCPVPADSMVTVPLAVNSEDHKVITLDFSDQKNLSDFRLYLYDKKSGTYQDLSQIKKLRFLSGQGNNSGRYFIILSRKEIANQNFVKEGMFVYGSGGSVFLFFQDDYSEKQVLFFDLTGKIVWTGKIAGDRAEVRPGLVEGIYVVRSSGAGGVFTNKFFFGK